MFEKGEYIIYGSNGVCEVQDYMNAAGEGDNRIYYVLAPMRSKGSTIFSPVDNQKVFMRKVMTKEEARELLRAFRSMKIWKSGIPEHRNSNIKKFCKVGIPQNRSGF